MPSVPPPNTELSSSMDIMKDHQYMYSTTEIHNNVELYGDPRVLEFPTRFADMQCGGRACLRMTRHYQAPPTP